MVELFQVKENFHLNQGLDCTFHFCTTKLSGAASWDPSKEMLLSVLTVFSNTTVPTEPINHDLENAGLPGVVYNRLWDS